MKAHWPTLVQSSFVVCIIDKNIPYYKISPKAFMKKKCTYGCFNIHSLLILILLNSSYRVNSRREISAPRRLQPRSRCRKMVEGRKVEQTAWRQRSLTELHMQRGAVYIPLTKSCSPITVKPSNTHWLMQPIASVSSILSWSKQLWVAAIMLCQGTETFHPFLLSFLTTSPLYPDG